jgi:raffinose/stachyose/melibiose transport system substrate-binding protein
LLKRFNNSEDVVKLMHRTLGAASGPYRIQGATLPSNALQVAMDLQACIDKSATSPALEFLSPVKGPSLEQITVAVGSGLTPPAEGAAQYDKDVEKQAKQLGLPGWRPSSRPGGERQSQ